jgi:hypothetical protein
LQDRPGDNLAGHPSLLLSLMLFVPCKWTLGRGAPEANLAQDLSLSPSPPCTPNQHHPIARERPPTPHLPVPTRAKPLSLSFEDRGHPEHACADRGVGGKPPPATSPPGPPSHRRRRPMDGCRPRRPLATPQPAPCPRSCTVWTPRAVSPF